MVGYLYATLNVLFPTFVYIFLGWLICHRNILSAETFNAVNRMCFLVLWPISLFRQVSQSDFQSAVQPKLLILLLAGIVGAFLVSLFLSQFFLPDGDVSAVVQGIYRSNALSFVLAILGNMYPGQTLGTAGVLCAFAVPTFNILAVLLFELKAGKQFNWKSCLVNIAKNRLVLAATLGIVFSYFTIPIPSMLLSAMSGVANCTAPLSIMCLGAVISTSTLKKYRVQLSWAILGKLVVLPGIMLLLSVLAGFRGVDLASLFVLFAAPTATASYPMAQEMGGNGELAGGIVAMTSLCSIVTLFGWIFLLNVLQLI